MTGGTGGAGSGTGSGRHGQHGTGELWVHRNGRDTIRIRHNITEMTVRGKMTTHIAESPEAARATAARLGYTEYRPRGGSGAGGVR